MNPSDTHLLSVVSQNREQLIQDATDIAFEHGTSAIPRESVEQMIRGVLVVLEEAVRGESDEARKLFLETALPDLVASGTTPWADMLRNGLPCWGILVGQLVAAVKEEHRAACIKRLSHIMGEWWRDVSNAVLPLYKQRGEI